MFMNKQEADVLCALLAQPYQTQRLLAEASGHSLGAVNRSVRTLMREGWLDAQLRLSDRARALLARTRPRGAVILAAGPGLRMVPINRELPKALLQVYGEPLIERLIRQLHEAGVRRITVVVGFMKEQFEYLIDEYGVELIVNPAYAAKNNLHSLRLAAARLGNSYILPCDLWFADNPFCRGELYSWYLVGGADPASPLRLNRRGELVPAARGRSGNRLLGLASLLEEDCEALCARMDGLCRDARFDSAFWEEALWGSLRAPLHARLADEERVVEINTYEQLRELDASSDHLRSDALDAIAQALHCGLDEIVDIRVLKKGMTNRSILFSCRGERCIMRVPGEGTARLIDRRQEAAVYQAIAGRGLCDEPLWLDPERGYKITRFLDGVRSADAFDEEDLRRCMALLRRFHGMRLRVGHRFDLFGQIDFYESLREGRPSAYGDYRRTKEAVLSLRPYIEAHAAEEVLTHMDAVADNFLFHPDGHGGERLQLTDWEYAGMQDPHVDLAMFSIYSLYDRQQADRLIDLYFEGCCGRALRVKIYCYMAVCGLLWSNWCEYKQGLGVEFGAYSLRQYRYAKEFSRLALAEMEEEHA